VFDPIAMNELFPEKSTDRNDNESSDDASSSGTNVTKTWVEELKDSTASIATPVTRDEFNILYNNTSFLNVPNMLLPKQLCNTKGNYIISLSQLCRYLAQIAEQEYNIEIYPGFAASEVLLSKQDHANDEGTPISAATSSVIGIATRDVGIEKDGTTYKSTFARGVEIHAKHTLFAEGARGSCSEYIINTFQLRHPKNEDETTKSRPNHPKHKFGAAQTYGLGIKEVWQIPREQFQSGLVQHTIGFPLQTSIFDMNYGGSFLYHQDPDLVLIGYVVGLDYANPYLNPYKEFQTWKTHPSIAKHLQGGTCISYGARVLNEGGYHSIPNRLSVPGATLIGCSAGFLNAVKIKGTHTAMKSGMLAAESIYKTLIDDGVPSVLDSEDGTFDTTTYPYTELVEYTAALQQSWIYKELYEVRNAHAAFSKWGIGGGLVYTAFTTHISRGHEPWTLHNPKHTSDSDATQPASNYQPIEYPPADNKLTFDLLTNLQRSNTYHEEDQPCHLRIKSTQSTVPSTVSMPIYAGPEQRFCPAGVYEYVPVVATSDTKDDVTNHGSTTPTQQHQLVINGQNCIHCKCCSIKMPKEYIEWTVPEGGGGPQYQVM
jgi:electron-transferring-flavoprotein dehydrogenase